MSSPRHPIGIHSGDRTHPHRSADEGRRDAAPRAAGVAAWPLDGFLCRDFEAKDEEARY